jgi:hypothetical protein
MNDPRETFYRRAAKLQELDRKGILEIAYEGNIGFHELVQFYSKATDAQVSQLEYYLKTNQISQVVDLLEMVTGTRLVVPSK